MIRQNPYLVYLALLIPWLLGAIFFVSSAQEDSEIASRQQRANGVIVAHQPSNHNRYLFRFQVGGQDYIGSETPLAREPKIGDRVIVYYDPLNPTRNGMTDFSVRSLRERGPAIAIIFLSALFALGVVVLGRLIGRRQEGAKRIA